MPDAIRTRLQGVSHLLEWLYRTQKAARAVLMGMGIFAASAQARPSSLLEQTIAALDQDDVAQAQKLTDQTVANTSSLTEEPKTWYVRGVVYERKVRQQLATLFPASQDLETCLKAYRKSIQLSPENTNYAHFSAANLARLKVYLTNRGVRYARKGNWKGARRQFFCGLELAANDPVLCLYTAIALQHTRKPAEALEYYRRYIELIAPRVPPFEVYCAMLSLVDGLQEDAAAYTALLQATLHNYPWRTDTVFVQAQQSLKTDTDDLLRFIVSEKSNQALHAFQMGCWYRLEGRLEEALKAYERVVTSSSESRAALSLQQGMTHYQWVVRHLKKSADQEHIPDEKRCKTHLQASKRHFRNALKLGQDRALPYLDNLSSALDGAHKRPVS